MQDATKTTNDSTKRKDDFFQSTLSSLKWSLRLQDFEYKITNNANMEHKIAMELIVIVA